MTKLTDEAKKAIGEIRPSLLATASRTESQMSRPRDRCAFWMMNMLYLQTLPLPELSPTSGRIPRWPSSV